MNLELRLAVPSDCRTLFNWVNDPIVRQCSLRSELISWQEHVEWLNSCLRSDTCWIYIARDGNDNEIGQIRFNLANDHVAEIDVSIAPKSRHNGLGRKLIQAGVNEIVDDPRIKNVHAWIKEDNKASIKAFEHAGFVFKCREERSGIPCFCLSYSFQGEGI